MSTSDWQRIGVFVAIASASLVACRPPADEEPADDDGSGDDDDGGDDDGNSGDPLEIEECAQFPLPTVDSGGCELTAPGTTGVVLRGTVLDEDGILRGGEVLVRSDGRIACVACDCSDADGAAGVAEVNCGDAVISPALVNPHDHITYANNAPIGMGVDRYEHRHDWRTGADGHAELDVNDNASADVVLGAELRFIMGGATAAASAGGEVGLLRNLDSADTLEGLTTDYANSDTFPLDDANGLKREQGCDYGSDPTTPASIGDYPYLPHIAEGIDAAAANEFTCTSSRGPNDLIGEHTALIHGIALRPDDYAEMQQAGAMLVWSPRSNIVLYGNTAPVTAMDAMGLPIALGTDWVSSGSMNLLRELQCADRLDTDYFDDHFSDRELWRMVTSNAARATGAGSALGTLAAGWVGDIAVFRAKDDAQDHRAVIDANVEDVVLVLRAGEPLYGDDALLSGLGGADCETLDVCGVAKRACVAQDTDGRATLAGVRAALEASYPLFFCGEPDDEPSCLPYRPGSYAGRNDHDADGDGIDDGDDDCPRVFNPVRELETAQGDADQDGRGDVCDPCPLDDADACAAD
ncbi:MAG TPA: amidohydrolase family protein [Nannocystaceae bacterium]|nr:amidohydrolase family protein [Nannocystaceae bacterium]